MSPRLVSWLVGVAIAAGALVAGAHFLAPEVHLDAGSNWRSFSTGLRRSGLENSLAGAGRVRLRLTGMRAQDSVVLLVSARPGVDSVAIEASRGVSVPVRLSVGTAPVTIHIGPGQGSRLAIDVADADGSDRALYRLHDIAVVRGGWRGRVRPWLPAFAGLILFAAGRCRRGVVLAAAWALFAVFLSIGLALDSLDTASAPGSTGWVWLMVALSAAVSVIREPQLRALPKLSILGALALLIGVLSHIPGLNGSPYYEWTWQSLDGASVFAALLAASLPFFAARALHHTKMARLSLVLALLAACVGLFAFVAMTFQLGGLDRMHSIIEHPIINSYYADAKGLAAEPGWMASYPEHLVGRLQGHSLTKPAGPVLFFVSLIHLLGASPVTAAVGALLIALGAALAVPGVYVLAREFGESPEASFEAACVTALTPSLLLFFPDLDQAFPAMTCALLFSWHRAVTARSAMAAVCCGLCAFIASFFSYSFLVLGVAGLVVAARDPRQAARGASMVGVVMAAAYGLLFTMTGFNPIATFLAAFENQSRLSIGLHRAYSVAVLNDPLDFAMGAGWVASFLALITIRRSWQGREWNLPAATAVLQIAAVDLSGLLRVEAARVWLLLTPFVAIPAGRELASWNPRERTAGYVVMVLLLAALAQNMMFL